MVAFQIFGFPIYWYGIFYAVAFLLGYGGLMWIGKKKRFANFPKVQKILDTGLEDLFLAILLGVMIGGRLGHVLIYGEGYYFQHWNEIIKVWEGGMSFIGGIVGVVMAVGLFSWIKKLSRKDFFLLFDLILIFVPLGILLGRLGNFLNQELYGILATQLPQRGAQLFGSLGLLHQYPQVDNLLRVNTNVLSMIFEGLLLFGAQLYFARKMILQKKWKIGILTSHFVLRYALVRFLLEYLRADSQLEFIGLFSKSQRFFLPFFLLGIGMLVYFRKGKNQTLTLA